VTLLEQPQWEKSVLLPDTRKVKRVAGVNGEVFHSVPLTSYPPATTTVDAGVRAGRYDLTFLHYEGEGYLYGLCTMKCSWELEGFLTSREAKITVGEVVNTLRCYRVWTRGTRQPFEQRRMAE